MEEACSKPFNILPGFKTSLDPQTTFCQNSCTGILHKQLMQEEQGCDASQLITTRKGMFYWYIYTIIQIVKLWKE